MHMHKHFNALSVCTIICHSACSYICRYQNAIEVVMTGIITMVIAIDHLPFGVWSIDDITSKHENGAWFAKCRASNTKNFMEGAV